MKHSKSDSVINSINIKPVFRFILITIVVVLTFIFFDQKIFLVNEDLGRHIKNGEICFQDWKVISTNYYSYTEQDLPGVNHHWGSGVLFYLLYKIVGFTGLSIFYCLISSITVLLFYLVAEKRSHSYLAFLFFIICIPLITHKVEIRPELFSMFFIGIYVFLFERYKEGLISFKSILITIPLLQLFWVNLHIYFVFGLFLIVVYGVNDLLSKKEGTIKRFMMLLALSILACLVNPAGIQGALMPFSVFNKFNYMVYENQSVFFIQNRFGGSVYLHFEIVSIFVLIIILILGYSHRTILKRYASELLCLLFFSALAFKSIRAIPIAAYFFLAFGPILCYAFIQGYDIKIQKNFLYTVFISFLILLSITIVKTNTYMSAFKEQTGFGLYDGMESSADFFKSLGLKGPIFNNYDIGGYLIFELFPQERVFVDNRPEAYSKNFFDKIYNPMLESEDVWKRVDSTFHFNCIYFYRLDETQYGQPFLIKRLNDRNNWVPVYVDATTIILLKRNEQNKNTIAKFELPATMFNAE